MLYPTTGNFGLESRLAEAKGADERTRVRFFAELAPRLETARELDLELDRRLARRFNVFDYLRTDERGLSRIIADLLNPQAGHGQGTVFLRTLLEELKWFPLRHDLDECTISASVEHRTSSGRKIDVVVRVIAPNRQAWCLAIENKPFAGDQENQVSDYLEYLEEKFGERFLLLYLPPTGEGPSERSVDSKELDERWKGRFGVVPYHEGQDEHSDEFDVFRYRFSLTGWFAKSREQCKVDRLRWFLHDAELFCRRTFGGQNMTTDSETKAVRDFAISSTANLRIAQVVHESWPMIRNEVCERFLRRLKQQIEDRMKESSSGIRVGYEWGNANWLWLYRDRWIERGEGYRGIRRRSVVMEANKKGTDEWFIGVWNPNNKKPNILRRGLVQTLGRGTKPEDEYPWWDWLDDEKSCWSVLVRELHEECGMDNGGEITNYFVERFVEVATNTIPIIDELESTGT